MRNYAESNRPAVYRPMRINQVQVKKFTGGHPYLQNGMFMRSSVSNPIYSYAKNFTKFKKDFSLFMWTPEKDQKKVEAHFDAVVKKLKREDVIVVINNIRPFNYVEPEMV